MENYQINTKKENIEYWMLDYVFNDGTSSWGRVPFLTWDQVLNRLCSLQSGRTHNNVMRVLKKEHTPKYEWSDLRLQKETDLDVMVDEDGNEEQSFPDDENYKFSPVCTKREYLFGQMYQGFADLVRSGEVDPQEFNSGIPDDELLREEQVIDYLRETYPDGINWDDYDADQNQQLAA